MAKQDKPRDRSFHWPPTAEELESIQVFDMSEDVPMQEPVRASTMDLTRVPPTLVSLTPASRTRPQVVPARVRPSPWRRFVENSAVTQVALVAASLAAVGIAITSMLAPRPLTHAPRSETRAAVVRPAAASPSSTVKPAPDSASLTASAPTAVAEEPTFRPMVTLDLEAPSGPTQAQAQPQRRLEAYPREHEAYPREHGAHPREIDTRSTSPHVRAVRRVQAGHDPVSRFAVRTGHSIWKAMRAVGRSFKRDPDEHLFARRSRAT